MSEIEICPLCQSGGGVSARRAEDSDFVTYTHKCAKYCISPHDVQAYLANQSNRPKCFPDRIIALLHERSLRSPMAPTPLLQFGDQEPCQVPGTAVVSVKDLLATWPESPREKINRTFLCMAHGTRGLLNGWISIDKNWPDKRFLLCEPAEQTYVLGALQEYGWIRKEESPDPHDQQNHFSLTPRGWSKFEELTEGEANAKNPVFVAMAFGKDRETKTKQKVFFEEIYGICKGAGWRAERSDDPEHNDSIIDKILFMVRQAPFVIADLSDGNHGAYYEAGFARGLGRPVIYLAREGADVHFDLTGVNQVRWAEVDELHRKLENRILGTIGRGKHKFDQQQ